MVFSHGLPPWSKINIKVWCVRARHWCQGPSNMVSLYAMRTPHRAVKSRVLSNRGFAATCSQRGQPRFVWANCWVSGLRSWWQWWLRCRCQRRNSVAPATGLWLIFRNYSSTAGACSFSLLLHDLGNKVCVVLLLARVEIFGLGPLPGL